MKNVALYMRVSTDQQVKHGDSLREQQDTLQEYVDSQKDMIVYKKYIDDGISGQKLKRDEFQHLLADVEAGKIDIILFTKLDRWFRNLRHYLNTQETLDKHNVSWNAVSQQYYDTTTAYGRTFIAQVMSFAELEAQMTSERIRAVFENKIQQGEVVSGKVPLGYSIKEKRLVPNKDKKVIQELFNFFLVNNSLRATVRFLHDEHNISRDYQSVKNMLSNEKYAGINRGNTNYCEPIIDYETFSKVQTMLTKNIKASAKRTYIFSGMLVCSECNRRLCSQVTYKKYTRVDGSVTKSNRKHYRCPTHRNNKNVCSNKKLFYEDLIENYLLENIEYLYGDAESLAPNKKQKKDNVVSHNKRVHTKLNRLKEAYLNEIISLDEYKIDREKLENQLKSEPEKVVSISDFRAKIPKNINLEYPKLSEEAKRYFWRSIIDKIIVKPDGSLKVIFL